MLHLHLSSARVNGIYSPPVNLIQHPQAITKDLVRPEVVAGGATLGVGGMFATIHGYMQSSAIRILV